MLTRYELDAKVNANDSSQKKGHHSPPHGLSYHRLFYLVDVLLHLCSFDFKGSQPRIGAITTIPPVSTLMPVFLKTMDVPAVGH